MRELLLVLLLTAGGAFPAVVLPRPPSSPNYIPQEYVASNQEAFAAKEYNAEKALYQSTNVEKPDTQDYRYVRRNVIWSMRLFESVESWL